MKRERFAKIPIQVDSDYMASEAHDFQIHVSSLIMKQFQKSIKDVTFGHSCGFSGRSRREYGFELSAVFNVAGLSFTIVVKIKWRKRHISADEVEKLWQAVSDIGADKAILATNTEFSPAAIAYAKTCGITLLRLEQSFGKDVLVKQK